jgi:single-strand DNA-binding protein
MNYNKVILIGRLVKEPQTVMLPSGSQVSNLVIAYNRRYKTGDQDWKEESHFFEVKVFGKLAENIIPQLEKGDLVLVEGRLHQDRWEDKESGKTRSKVRIVALTIKVIAKSQKGTVEGKPLTDEGLEEFPESLDIPELEGEKKVEKKESESLDELENLIFGEEEKGENKNKKDDDLGDFDILL